MGEERVTEVETRVIVEGIDSDTEIVSDIREGEGEIEMIVESTKIREGGEEEIGKEGEGRGEKMKGREVRMIGEEGGRHTTSSSAKSLHIPAHSVLQIFLASSSGCSSASKYSD